MLTSRLSHNNVFAFFRPVTIPLAQTFIPDQSIFAYYITTYEFQPFTNDTNVRLTVLTIQYNCFINTSCVALNTAKGVLNGEHQTHLIDPFARVCAGFGRKNGASEQSREPLDSHTKNVQSKLRIHFYLAKFMRQSNLSRKSPFEQNTATSKWPNVHTFREFVLNVSVQMSWPKYNFSQIDFMILKTLIIHVSSADNWVS